MKLVILEVSVKSEAEVEEEAVVLEDNEVVVMAGVASTTRGIVVVVAVMVAHSSSSLSRLLTAILGNKIYLPDDNDNNTIVSILVDEHVSPARERVIIGEHDFSE